ncbi:undecaprenyl-phosphate glucose phosphotransferase [Methylosinus sp. Sm6]|uniref:undecaprenyl-phosphate glucose phosphotransferase n=1 Tax=Methylosinus sp. Sm6 TaxID=2866948 RepID=UPI00351D32B5
MSRFADLSIPSPPQGGRIPGEQDVAARRSGWSQAMPGHNTALVRASFSVMAALLDFAIVLWSAIGCESLYHSFAYSSTGLTLPNLRLCLFAAILFVLSNVMRHEYSIKNYLDFAGHGWRCFMLWTVAVLCTLAFGFLAKATEESSRAAFVLFYAIGMFAIYVERASLVLLVKRSAERGGVSARRVFLVGFEREIEAFTQRYHPWKSGMNVVAAVALRDEPDALGDDLALAQASARMLRPDDVFILAPWSRPDVIDNCVTAFLRVPASIHLGPERVLDRFVDAHVNKIGAIASLNLNGRPHDALEIVAKRATDVVLAALGLVVLSPLLLLVAMAIKLDSQGPVLFFQRRYGFNREPFRIAKFRSMTTMEDGRNVTQATAGDARITRVGRFIRRYNIDELPQLINVLRGDMSLVGPRPHALVHDQLYESEIALYARRHNVKPGITGWAQVNGLRGEIDSPEKIRARVEHDLYYIDHWSLPLDLWIIFMTVFSKKAYRNAL